MRWLGSRERLDGRGSRARDVEEPGALRFGLTVALAMVVGALTVVAATSAGASSAGSALVRVRAATVRIESHGCGPDSTATGVRLADGRVLTNRHAVAGDEVRVDGTPVTEVDLVVGADAAYLAAGPRGVGVDLAARTARPGDTVWVTTRRDGLLRTREARITSSVAGTGPADPPWAWRLDLSVEPGDSGSPVVDRDGDLVGLVYAAEYGSTAALVVPTEALDGDTVPAVPCA